MHENDSKSCSHLALLLCLYFVTFDSKIHPWSYKRGERERKKSLQELLNRVLFSPTRDGLIK